MLRNFFMCLNIHPFVFLLKPVTLGFRALVNVFIAVISKKNIPKRETHCLNITINKTLTVENINE